MISGLGRSDREGIDYPLQYFWVSLVAPGKESACNAGDLGLLPGLGRSPGEGKDYSLQYFGLENSMDFIVHGVAKSQTRLSDFHFLHLFKDPYPQIPSQSDILRAKTSTQEFWGRARPH